MDGVLGSLSDENNFHPSMHSSHEMFHPPVISSYSELKYRRQKHILLPARISEAKQLEKMPLLSDLQKLSCRPSTASPMKSAGSQPQAGFAPGKEAAAVTG